jgi:two-component system chemotaxis sensor kinase CheA/two-component system sensor histidine kinase and response regulator WspE
MGVAEEIRQKLLPRFREMTTDRVEKISSALEELGKGAGGKELLEELARELHTLKGEARMMGFVGIAAVVHAAEDLLKVLVPESPGERLAELVKRFKVD